MAGDTCVQCLGARLDVLRLLQTEPVTHHSSCDVHF